MRVVADAERIETAEDGMLFAKLFLPEHLEEESPPFHYEMLGIALQQGEFANLWADKSGAVFAAPRGFAKSTLISLVVPLFWGCHKRKRFIVMVSNTDSQAEMLAETIRKEFEENEHIKEVFGELRGDRFVNGALKWTNQDFTIAHTDPPGSLDRRHITWTTRYVARGMLVKIRGAKSRARRPDGLILDDCENQENVVTPEQREKVWLFFTKTLLPMLVPRGGTFLAVGTVLHLDSLLARLLGQKYGRFYIRRLWKAIVAGESIFPARFPVGLLLQMKEKIGGAAWASEYENNPVDEEARKFRPEWMKWYRRSDLTVRGGALFFRGQPLRIIMGVDPAIEEKEDAAIDEFAVVVLGVTPARDVLILWVYHDRIDFPAQVNMLLQTKDHWAVALTGMEKPGYQRVLAQQAFIQSKKRFQGIRQLKNTAPKYERITAMSTAWERGKVYLRAAEECTCGTKGAVHTDACKVEPSLDWDELKQNRLHSSMVDFYAQLVNFPVAPHDDMPDACCNAMQVVVGRLGFAGYF